MRLIYSICANGFWLALGTFPVVFHSIENVFYECVVNKLETCPDQGIVTNFLSDRYNFWHSEGWYLVRIFCNSAMSLYSRHQSSVTMIESAEGE